MMRTLAALRAAIGRAIDAAVIALMAVLVADVVWQVLTRFVLRAPSPWSEELARILLIWLALLGAAAGFARGAHLGVDVLVARLPPRERAACELFVHVLVALFAAVVMLYGGGRLVAATLATRQVSASLGIRMGYVYLAVPLSGAFILLVGVERILRASREAWPTEGDSAATRQPDPPPGRQPRTTPGNIPADPAQPADGQ